MGKAFPCLQPPQRICAVFRHPFERGRPFSPPQRPLHMVAAYPLRRSLLDPHLRAYASRDRLQGRRPPLPETGMVIHSLMNIRVPLDGPLRPRLWLPPAGGPLAPWPAAGPPPPSVPHPPRFDSPKNRFLGGEGGLARGQTMTPPFIVARSSQWMPLLIPLRRTRQDRKTSCRERV